MSVDNRIHINTVSLGQHSFSGHVLLIFVVNHNSLVSVSTMLVISPMHEYCISANILILANIYIICYFYYYYATFILLSHILAFIYTINKSSRSCCSEVLMMKKLHKAVWELKCINHTSIY